MRIFIIGLIRAYQFLISPMLGPSCRYYPTCSEYAAEAIKKHGAIKGSYLAAHRVLRCHPGCDGGIDLVPEKQVCSKKVPQKRCQHLSPEK